MPENHTTPADSGSAPDLTTEQFGKLNGIRPGSVRAQFYKTGSYFNVTPRKRANGRLVWPAISVTSEAAK
jgi:hypothetical protein